MADNSLALLANISTQLAPNARKLKYADQDLGAGIQAPFAVIGYKGGRWSVRHRGSTKVLERFDEKGRPDGFVPYLDLVVLYAAGHNSKVYYATGYVEGSDSPPDCWSTDGQKPDGAAMHKQNPTCLDCRHNVRGSRVNTATGAKGKACSDFRRWAVVPYEDIENTLMGGPMLLRIPPASLGGVGEYSDKLKANSVPYAAIATRVGFDGKEAFPKLTFQPYAVLTQDEVDEVIKMQAHPLVERIVSEQVENLADQPTSEEGKAVTTSASVPPSGEQVTKGNGAVTDRPKTSAFARAAQKPAEEDQPKGASAPQPTRKNEQAAPAATAAEGLTPEQLKIRDLEAQLAAAKGGTGKAPRKRSAQVAPQAKADAHTPAEGEEDGSGTGDAVETANDPALAIISARLDKLL
jgi:hypothetical protein